MSNLIFRVGDAVFSIFYGWGTVEAIAPRNLFPVEVRFKIGKRTFKHSGAFSDQSVPTLSFTEYDLFNGGQSMQRPGSKNSISNLIKNL